MTLDQMVRRATAGTAEATTPLSTTSFLRWCVHDINGAALVCASCDVSWLRENDECCWMCGEPGQRARDLRRAASFRASPTSA
jgi:predicted amidophosphoribosyltransferase